MDNIINVGMAKTSMIENGERSDSSIQWKYDDNKNNLSFDLNNNGRTGHFDVKLNANDLRNLLSIPTVNEPIMKRLKRLAANKPQANDMPMMIEMDYNNPNPILQLEPMPMPQPQPQLQLQLQQQQEPMMQSQMEIMSRNLIPPIIKHLEWISTPKTKKHRNYKVYKLIKKTRPKTRKYKVYKIMKPKRKSSSSSRRR
jgi:hypothetical protein